MHDSPEYEQRSQRVEPERVRVTHFEQSEHEQCDRHRFDEVAMSSDATCELRIAAVQQENARFRAPNDDERGKRALKQRTNTGKQKRDVGKRNGGSHESAVLKRAEVALSMPSMLLIREGVQNAAE